MKKTLHLKLLGEFSAEIENAPPLSFAARRAEVMVAYLAVTNRPHAREKMATLLWDDRTQEQALANLRSLLAQLPKPIKSYLTINRQTISIAEEAPIWLDTAVFSKEIETAMEQGQETEAIEQMEAALTHYRGEFLEGVLVRESRGLEEWIAITAERFHRLAAVAHTKLATYYLHQRQYLDGIRHATALLQSDPLQESNHRRLMLLLARSGQRNAALRQYQDCADILMEELGIEPASETTALYDRIRQARTTPPFVVPTTFTPFIGRQTALAGLIKRLDDPECRLITLSGPGGVGKTRLSLQAASELKGEYLHGIYFVPLAGVKTAAQLPVSIASALGFTFQDKIDPQIQLINYLRQREMLLILDNFEQIVEQGVGFIQELLSHAPLVKLLVTSRERLNIQAEYLQTLSGLSYEGKSEVTAENEALQLFLECAARHQADLELIGDKAEAALRICQMLEGLPLGIELVAASLAVYPIQQIEAELSNNLDFVSTHMRDLPMRHRSLRAVFQHSWQSLTERERAIYRSLSLFHGGFDSQAALAVAGANRMDLAGLTSKSLLRLTERDQYEIHQVLKQYTAEKLLEVPDRIEDGRNRHTIYYMNVLDEACTQMNSGKEMASLTRLNKDIDNIRHAWQWAVEHQLLDQLETGMSGLYHFYVRQGPFQEGFGLFESAVDTVKTAVSSSTDGKIERILAQQYTYLGRFSYELADYPGTVEIAKLAIDLAQQTEETAIEAEAQQLWGRALWRMGEYDTTRSQFQKALELSRKAGVKQFEADALRGLGVLEAQQGDSQKAIVLYETALQIYRAIGDGAGEATTLNNLGNLFDDIGNYTAAQEHHEQAIALHRERGDRKGAGNSLNNLGVVFRHQANHKKASECYTQALETFRGLGDRWREGLALINLSNIAIDQGEFTRANNLLPQALARFQEINDPIGEGNSLALSGKVFMHLGLYAEAQTKFEDALLKFEETTYAYSQGLCMAYLCLTVASNGDHEAGLEYGRKAVETGESIKNPPILGTAHTNMGLTHFLLGNFEQSRDCFQQAITIRQEIGEHLQVIESTAGLVLSLMEIGNHKDVLPLGQQLFDFLQQSDDSPLGNHPLTGTDNPILIYLALYKMFLAEGDERATALLQEAHDLIQERASHLVDETLKRPFLQKAHFNKDILEAYRNTVAVHS